MNVGKLSVPIFAPQSEEGKWSFDCFCSTGSPYHKILIQLRAFLTEDYMKVVFNSDIGANFLGIFLIPNFRDNLCVVLTSNCFLVIFRKRNNN